METLILIAQVTTIVLILVILTREDLFGNGGSKGITNEYTSKSGMKRTAKKSREDHIV
tara:strand:- start:285 stop:458 length:174 start_codon:yes stop_codon:yes gene_type:complete